MRRGVGWIVVLLTAVVGASAQMVLDALDMDEVQDCVPVIVGRDRAFAASATVRLERNGEAPQSVELWLMMRGGKIRAELDVEHINLRNFSPDELGMFKQLGLAQVTEITRPAEGFSYVVLPMCKAYCEVRPADIGKEARPKLRVVQKKVTGQEELDKHPCAVNEVTLAPEGDDHMKMQVTTWETKDLKDFPIKMVIHDEEGAQATIQFKDLDLNPPDDWLFDPPVGWRRYPGVEQMMEDRMRQIGGMFIH